ncbi:rev protein [Simian immunodeficiency virus]|uniref:Protein Rev n=1 Tax=Simian immunodeficiency virus TaxID=11723 RepID=A4UDF8_SIV|nr:rev protein [Simian immunodeficiency virus]
MAGASGNDQELIRFCRQIRILYDSSKAGLLSPLSTDPYPTVSRTRATRKNRKRRWKKRQAQILVAVFRRPPQPNDLDLPDLDQLRLEPLVVDSKNLPPPDKGASKSVDSA